MNIKIAIVGGIAFYAAQFLVGMATGSFIHEGILDPLYRVTSEFWRPELNQDPPDIARLMPRWIITGLTTSFIMAGIYSILRTSYSGAAWLKGAKFGLTLAILMACWSAAWSGIFNLPEKIWLWWNIESFLYFVIGGSALGWVAEKVAPENAE